MNVLKRNKGFTLVELIVVIAIIGILSAVLIPSFTMYVNKAKQSAAEQNAMTMHSEFLATLLDDVDVYEVMERGKYIVNVDDAYYVVIDKSSLVETYEYSDVTLGDAGTDDGHVYYYMVKAANGTITVANTVSSEVVKYNLYAPTFK